jgi:hypothetical protein
MKRRSGRLVGIFVKRNGNDHEMLFMEKEWVLLRLFLAAGEGFEDNVKFIVAESVYPNLEELTRYLLKECVYLPSFPILNMIESKNKKTAGYTFEDINVVAAAKKKQLYL